MALTVPSVFDAAQEVAAVRVWHEVKAHAAEVARVAQELAGHVRTWLERAADHVLDMMHPRRAAACGAAVLDMPSCWPIADVAYRFGFADQAQFSRLFKRMFAISPSGYRAAATGVS